MPCVVESGSPHVKTHGRDWIALSKRKIAIQVGLVRLSTILTEGTHTALSRALHAFGSGSRLFYVTLPEPPMYW